MKKITRERVLLTILVAIAFFGFLLWSIQKSQSEENAILSTDTQLLNTTASNNVLTVLAPKMEAQIKSPLTVSGAVTLGDNRVRARLKNSNGLVLAEIYATTKKVGSDATFSATLSFKKPVSTKGTLEVFLVTNKGGVQNNLLAIPVVFQ